MVFVDAESCPAFLNGCPYAAQIDLKDLLEARGGGGAAKCPAFGDGCPFRGAPDMDALRGEFQKLPPSHADDRGGGDGGAGTPAHAALLETFRMVHQTSQHMKEQIGECPVFQQECPFKNCVTSRGVPLVRELEARSWGAVYLVEMGEAAGDAVLDETLAPHAHGVQGPEERMLSRMLKLGTQEAHSKAENTHFMREFIRGRAPRGLYVQLLVNLHHVYAAMEEALEEASSHPLVEYLYFPDELCRAEALRQDIGFFSGPDWEGRTAPSPVTEEYVARLRRVARSAPELLTAHAYTRYLGDLSGGQLLKRAAVRGYGLPPGGGGVQFYTFRRVPDVKAFKGMYRARLDSLGADQAAADAMVVEANLAFDLNTRMFQELDRLAGFEGSPEAPPAGPEAASNAGSRAAAANAAVATAAAAGCPFAALAGLGVEMPAGHAQVAPPAAAAAGRRTSPRSRPEPHRAGFGHLGRAVAVVALAAAVVAAVRSCTSRAPGR